MMKREQMRDFAAVAITVALEFIFYAFSVLGFAAVGVHYGQSGCHTRSNWVHHEGW